MQGVAQLCSLTGSRAILKLHVRDVASSCLSLGVLALHFSSKKEPLQDEALRLDSTPWIAVQETGTELTVMDLSVRRRLSFLDYMAGGCEIQCMLAVDFSSSNAPLDDPSSFHFAGIKPFWMQIQTLITIAVCPTAIYSWAQFEALAAVQSGCIVVL